MLQTLIMVILQVHLCDLYVRVHVTCCNLSVCRETEKTNEEIGLDIPTLLFGLELDSSLE
jgi:hypothetical protein